MKSILSVTVLAVAVPAAIPAQTWEFGAVGGASVYRSKKVTAGQTSGTAGFEPSFAAGGLVGQNLYRYIGGELRYLYEQNSLKVEAEGTKASFAARSHAVHYDLLFHLTPAEAKVRPFVAVGGGAKRYLGTGNEVAFQPLSTLALLTKTDEWKYLLTAGGGVKFVLGEHVSARVEFRNYMTPFPTKVLAPGRNASGPSGWVHNFVPMFGIGYIF